MVVTVADRAADAAHPQGAERARYSPAMLHGTHDREGLLWVWGEHRREGFWPLREGRDDAATLGTQVRARIHGSLPPLAVALMDLTRAYDLAGLSKVERDVLHAYYVEGLGGKWRDRGEHGGYWRHVEAHYREHGEMPRTVLSAGAAVNASAVGDGRVAEHLHMARSTASGLRWRAIRKLCAYLNGERRGPS